MTFLWNYLKKYKRFLTQLILGLLLGSFLQLVFPFLTQAIVDTGIGGKDVGFVWLVLLAEMMFFFSRTAIDFIRSKILLHISTRINISLISDFFIKQMKLPMKFFDIKLMGDLLQRIEDHRRVEQFLTSSSLSLLFSFFTFLVFGVVLAVYNLGIFLVFFQIRALSPVRDTLERQKAICRFKETEIKSVENQTADFQIVSYGRLSFHKSVSYRYCCVRASY